MQESRAGRTGAMAAILGLSPAVVADACKRAAEGGVCTAANLNSARPDRYFRGRRRREKSTWKLLRSWEPSAQSCSRECAPPFLADEPARKSLEKDLRATGVRDPQVPSVTNV